jgi:pantetheine-phosphate adenylyltransferase
MICKLKPWQVQGLGSLEKILGRRCALERAAAQRDRVMGRDARSRWELVREVSSCQGAGAALAALALPRREARRFGTESDAFGTRKGPAFCIMEMALGSHNSFQRRYFGPRGNARSARNIFLAFLASGITLCRHMANPANGRKIGVFPGQFDPITNGHLDVIKRGMRLFDELIVAVGINPDKTELFTLDERVEMIGELIKPVIGARVEKYEGLTAEFVRNVRATAILRGIRDVSDLRYEFQLALANRAVGAVETVFIMTGDQYALTSSSLIRQIVALGGDVKALGAVVPASVLPRLKEKQRALRKTHRPAPDAPAT